MIYGIVFDHAETPGLGGEITQNISKKLCFVGKYFLMLMETYKVLKIIKGYAGGDDKSIDGEVDSISGATLTGNE